jgi:hypothetical protein
MDVRSRMRGRSCGGAAGRWSGEGTGGRRQGLHRTLALGDNWAWACESRGKPITINTAQRVSLRENLKEKNEPTNP